MSAGRGSVGLVGNAWHITFHISADFGVNQMAKTDSDAVWTDVDVATFSVETQAAYANYKDAQRKAASLREQFETVARAGLPVPQGMRVVFGYRFGKLSAALVPDDRKPVKAKAAVGSLADFIAAQSAQGRAM